MSDNDDEHSTSTSTTTTSDSASSNGDSDSSLQYNDRFERKKYYIREERPRNILNMSDYVYGKYTHFPNSGYIVALAHVSRAFMSSARLLPSISKSKFKDPSRIQRNTFIDNRDDTQIWWFYGKYFHGTKIYQFIVEEANVSGYEHQFRRQINELFIDRPPMKAYEDFEKMAKRLYMLHFFKHDNLLSAYFTLSEPWIFRMNTALPNNVSLLEVSRHLYVQENNRCPSIKYFTICMLRALEYLHESNIVHKDVKIENWFYDFKGNLLLGEFDNADICDQQEEKSYDIWNIGTTLLDYCFNTTVDFNQYGQRYPDPTCIEGYPDLFDKMQHFHPHGLNGNEGEWNRLFTTEKHTVIHDFATPRMYQFLLRIFQAEYCPSATTLLETDEFLRISAESEFGQLKLETARKCFMRHLIIKPFDQDGTISTLFKTIRPLNVFKKKSYNKFVYKTISRSSYRSVKSRKQRYQFVNRSEIQVDFTIVSEIYDDVFTFKEVFDVGDERSIFKALFNLIKVVDSPQRIPKIQVPNKADPWWYPLHSPGQFFFAWDIFRLRAALDAILSDAAHCKHDPVNANYVSHIARRFPLCHHKKGISRHVDIEIGYIPADIEKKQ